MMARLPASVEVDDLIQVGLIGLMDAVDRFDGSQGAQFESYATQRIRGAMLDDLRDADWLPRHIRQKSRQIESAINKLAQRQGRPPTEQEISTEMGIPLSEYQSMLGDVKGNQLLYYEDFSDEESSDYLQRYLVDDLSDPLSLLGRRRRGGKHRSPGPGWGVTGEGLRLTVYRMPEPGSEESELMIFFRGDQRAGDLARGTLSGDPAPRGRPIPRRFQPGPESVLRLQRHLPLPCPVARQRHHRAHRSRRTVPRRMTVRRRTLIALAALLAAAAAPARAQSTPAGLAGPWRAALDLARGELRFRLAFDGVRGQLCNADVCEPFSAVAQVAGTDTVVFEMADYAAALGDT